MHRFVLILVGALAFASPLQAQQRLRDRIAQLFIFGEGEDPLFLAGTADPNNPASIQAHGAHFIPSAVDNNSTLIGFLTNAVSLNVANIPISATSSGQTFRFVGGVPVATSASPGPVFGERAQTLGRGRVLVGTNVNVFHFTSVRGVSLDDVQLNFTHANADFDGCDTIFGGDCTLQGIPTLENDFIQLDLDMNLDVRSVMFALSYGLFDWADIGVAVPIVTTSLRATSSAQVVPFGGPSATHFFTGTPSNPNLFATRSIDGTATGLGDVAARLKVAVRQSGRANVALLGDVRFATGSAEDLLGSGSTAIRGLGIVSAQLDDFSPHINVGYLHRTDSLQTDAMLATIGFDKLLAPWVGFAADLISELQVGENALTIPKPLRVDKPFRRLIPLTNIPNSRDDIINGAFGLKFLTSSGLTIVTNSLIPLNRGGLRATVAWTVGLEYNF
ncbi:MAG TPA: hypothetical protein VGA37_06085 [Gemmatimonadales bacterium]